MKLSFFQERTAEPVLSFGVSDLEIRGGEISGFMSSRAIARYTQSGWQYGDRSYVALVVTGGGRLLFGVRHTLMFISDPLEHFYFLGPCLSVNGVAIAKYDRQSDLWRGIERPMWCHGWRIVNPERASQLILVDRIARLNPWETQTQPPVEHPSVSALYQSSLS